MSASRFHGAVHGSVTACLVEAQSNSHEIQEKALQKLASLTKVSPPNRNLLAKSDGAILTLLKLSRSSSDIKLLSLSILFNLSLNSNLKQTLADMDTIQHLNSIILASSSRESGKLAASIICSLAMLDKNKALLGVAGTIQALVKALDGPRCVSTHHLLSSLAELVQFHGNCSLVVHVRGVPVLIKLVESTDGEDLAGTALAVLGLLARFEEGMEAIKNTNGIVSLMVDILKRRCMMSKEGASEILLRLFDENEIYVRDAVELPEFSSLLADISVRGSAIAREKASVLMKKMMEANLDSYSETNPMFYY